MGELLYQRVPACLTMWLALQFVVFITIAKVCVVARGSKHWLVKTRGDVMGMGGHHRRGASKMFLVETKGGYTNKNYLRNKHKTRGAGDYSMAGNKFNARSLKSRHSISTSDHFNCKSCEDYQESTDKCYWDEDEEKCFPHQCVEDKDCIGQKFDNGEVSEEGDMWCTDDDDDTIVLYGNECVPEDCDGCEGCKDFRCRDTHDCAAIKNLGENSTTCVSRSCRTNEDCKKFVGNLEYEVEEDYWVCDKDEDEDEGLCFAKCKSCEGCQESTCDNTDKCYWDEDQEKCFSNECMEDKDCVGKKFDNGEVSEEGDMWCSEMKDCFPAECDVCEGCKDFKCSHTQTCAAIKKLGENTTTCVSRSCKTHEDCQKFVGKTYFEYELEDDEEDDWVRQRKKEDHWICDEDEGMCFAKCENCEGCQESKCDKTDKCYWDEDEEECFSHKCMEDKDCIGQKFDNGEVSEEGDSYCYKDKHDGNRCGPKECDVCEGCKDFRCRKTYSCTTIQKSGENTTTCASLSCKTNEDCKKFIGKTYYEYQFDDGDTRVRQKKKDDYWVCQKSGSLEVWKYGWCLASCKSCEGCQRSNCRNTENCIWNNWDEKCSPRECLKNEDCIGHKMDNNEISEDGDMICHPSYGKCKPKSCDVCEGCKAFRCSSFYGLDWARNCLSLRKLGVNTTTCVTPSCKTNEDCTKYVGTMVLRDREDVKLEDGDMVCDKKHNQCTAAPCKVCEGCKQIRCFNTEKCNWDHVKKICEK